MDYKEAMTHLADELNTKEVRAEAPDGTHILTFDTIERVATDYRFVPNGADDGR